MESRERVYRAIDMSGPDRLPFMHHSLPGAFIRHGERLEKLYEKYPSDILSFGYDSSEEYGPEMGIGVKDRWGCVWVRLIDNNKGQVVVHPLADWRALTTYGFPDPLGWPEFSLVEKALEEDGGRHYILVDGDTLWQRMFYLKGHGDALRRHHERSETCSNVARQDPRVHLAEGREVDITRC